MRWLRVPLLMACLAVYSTGAVAQDEPRIDYLSLAQGALPVVIGGDANALRVGMDHALLAIDGNGGGFSMTPKPGTAESRVEIVYALPALTTFDTFAIPNVRETPSPSQTFFRNVEIAGSDTGSRGPFEVLASATLSVHDQAGQTTTIPASADRPVRWLRLTLSGGLDIQRDKTFFEFSEIIGHGVQEAVPLSTAFSGKWKGRGVLLELKQDDVRVTGCYDGEGDLGGTVSGNLVRATGKSRKGGIPSTFVLAVGADGGIVGVRSTNGAPFRLYAGAAAPKLKTECSTQPVPQLGCGSIIHGINFDFDSATIRPASEKLLDALSAGLQASTAPAFTLIGHTSSEGADAYNDDLSQRRAQAVAAAMVARGLDPARVSAEGRGERQPIADNTTETGRSMNRRVEIACH